MAKVTVAGNAMVITSELTIKMIKELEKYRPNALRFTCKDENGTNMEMFRIALVDGDGSLTRHGITFDRHGQAEDTPASLTVILPAGSADKRKYVVEEYGDAIVNIGQIEKDAKCYHATLKTKMKDLEEKIEVV